MKKITRKTFLQHAGLASASVLIPKFLHGLGASPFGEIGTSGKTLVIIQLSGGNDGLNTFIPYRNDLYYKLRPDIAIASQSALPAGGDMAFHPATKPLLDLFQSGEMTVINNVGYPNPDHSHFRSMDIWTSASDSHEYIETGWIGRWLDSVCTTGCQSHLALETDDLLGRALKGQSVKGISTSHPERLYRAAMDPFTTDLAALHAGTGVDNRAYLYKTLAETTSSVDYLYRQSKIYKSSNTFPTTAFGNRMKLISELICSGCETRVYYISLSGFDTHANQLNGHERLLKMLADSVQAMITELKANNRFRDTLIMGFSEFGRRVKQNGSRGTDHGEANNMFLIGGSLKKSGFLNDPPDLQSLSDGNLRFETDFRSVYATVLKKWFGVDDEKILGAQFAKMDFI
jgi:uncharacterized protein (DUF1501 family)